MRAERGVTGRWQVSRMVTVAEKQLRTWAKGASHTARTAALCGDLLTPGVGHWAGDQASPRPRLWLL